MIICVMKKMSARSSYVRQHSVIMITIIIIVHTITKVIWWLDNHYYQVIIVNHDHCELPKRITYSCGESAWSHSTRSLSNLSIVDNLLSLLLSPPFIPLSVSPSMLSTLPFNPPVPSLASSLSSWISLSILLNNSFRQRIIRVLFQWNFLLLSMHGNNRW